MAPILGNPVHGPILLSPSGGKPFRSQRFGCTGYSRERPYGNCAHFNRGVDIAAPIGTDLLAVEAGTVFYAGTITGGSRSVALRIAGGWAVGYDHMQDWAVSKGQHVIKGQKIGDIGMTGNTSGPHVDMPFKSGFPANGDVNAFFRDPGVGGGAGRWEDIWKYLYQNVTVRPDPAMVPGTNIRTKPDLSDASLFATTRSDGHIRRIAGDGDLGLTALWRPYHGQVTGSAYEVGGKTSNLWWRIFIGGADRYIAMLKADRSV